MVEYHFVTTYEIQAPAEKVWSKLRDFGRYPAWSRGIVAARELEPGDEDGVGAKIRYKIKGRLPFTLVLDATITQADAPRTLELQAMGELEGVGRWTLQQHQEVTTAQYTWDVRTTKRWMNLVAPLARPLFRWNHDGVMRAFGEGLARSLGGELLAIQLRSRRDHGHHHTTEPASKGVDEPS